MKDIDIKIIEINNIILFNAVKVDDNIEPIEKFSMIYPVLPLINHINDFYGNVENFPIKFFDLRNISEFPNVPFLSTLYPLLFCYYIFCFIYIFEDLIKI